MALLKRIAANGVQTILVETVSCFARDRHSTGGRYTML
jgi:hypothetical protein